MFKHVILISILISASGLYGCGKSADEKNQEMVNAAQAVDQKINKEDDARATEEYKLYPNDLQKDAEWCRKQQDKTIRKVDEIHGRDIDCPVALKMIRGK